MSAPPPGRPAPPDSAVEEIRAAHVRGPNGWCDEDVQDWPCDVADLLEDRDALSARLADAEAALAKRQTVDPEWRDDPEVGVGYLRLVGERGPGSVARTISVNHWLLIDVDANGYPMGVEILYRLSSCPIEVVAAAREPGGGEGETP